MKHTVDLQLNNGKNFKNIEYSSATADGMWQSFKLQDESIMSVPTLSIAYIINVNSEIVTEDEDE